MTQNLLRRSSLEDIDTSLFDWIDKSLNIRLKNNKGKIVKVSTIMAGSERWFMAKNRNKKVRDSTNTLILPIIAIRRLDFEKVQDSWALGRFFKTISYAKVINGVETANRANNLDARRRNNYVPASGGHLHEKAPVYEMIEIPYPTFIKVNYSIEIWSQYVRDLNNIFEKFWAKTHDSAAGSNQIQIKSRNDNRYIVFMETTIVNNSNIEDYSDTERVIKGTLNLKVLGYLLDENDASITKSVPCVSTISALKETVITDKKEIEKIFGK